MTDQKLTDELEKALRDEVYDGGMGALSPDQLTDYVRGLAVTAAKVVEEAHTPTDDEREALLAEADRWPAGLPDDPTPAASPHDMIARLAAAVRRSEVPEPSTDGPAIIAMMPPSPETSKRWYSMYCRVCGIEEMMADTADDPLLVARRDGHNRGHHLEPQGEPSDAQDIVAQGVSRLAGMKLLRRYSQFSDEWWNQLHAGIARVALTAAAVTEQGENRDEYECLQDRACAYGAHSVECEEANR